MEKQIKHSFFTENDAFLSTELSLNEAKQPSILFSVEEGDIHLTNKDVNGLIKLLRTTVRAIGEL